MRRKLSIASWALFIIVTPLTFLGIIAQNTIPGEFLYSIKRTYEDGALLALSVFPSAKADYTTNLASTRYTEAEKLIVKKSDTQGLTALVTQVQQAKQEISTVSDPKQKEELQQKLVTSITQYQQGLNVVAAQVATQNSIAFVPTAINDTQPTENTAYTPPVQQNFQPPQQYNNPPAQNAQPQQPPAQNPPQGGQLPPTPTQIQPIATNPPVPGSGSGSTPTDIITSIKNTQNTLGALKNQVQQSQMMIQSTPGAIVSPTYVPPTIIPSPTHAPSPTYYYHPSPTNIPTPTERPHGGGSGGEGSSGESHSNPGD